jgi:hypothetical protein
MSNESNIWVDSLWTTRKESVILKDGDDIISREISVGMSVKADKGTPSAVLHEKLNQALTKLIEDEKDAWLTAELIKRERHQVKESIYGIDELVNGKYKVTQPVNKPAGNAKPNNLML